MKYLQIYIIYCFLLPFSIVNSQQSNIRLKVSFQKGFGPFYGSARGLFPVHKTDSAHVFKKIFPLLKGTPKNLKNIKRYFIWFEPYQFAYQNYTKGSISKKDYDYVQKIWDWVPNTKKLSKKELKCYVNIIYADNERGEKVCIVDANNNWDFSDDRAFIPIDSHSSFEDIQKNLITINCQRLLNGKIINDTTSIVIVVGNAELKFSIAEYVSAKYTLNGKIVSLAACPAFFYSRSYVHSELSLLKSSQAVEKLDIYNEIMDGDYFEIDNALYKYIGVDMTRNELVIQRAKYTDKHSAQLGFYAPEFKDFSLIDSSVININNYKGRYVLLDFWGTWCLPCRAEIPFLKEAKKIFDPKIFEIIAIASDDNAETIRALVKKEGMVWPQLLSDKITKEYKVVDFPTNFLIDPKGKIIARNLRGENLVDRIKSFLEEDR